jgi:hypothetical protein
MANDPKHDETRHSGDKSHQNQTKRPGQHRRQSDMSAPRAPTDHRRDTRQDEGMKRPVDMRDDAKR